MNMTITSPLWYRIAPLTVRLRRDASVHRHRYRGKIWYVLQDRVSGKFMRFTPEAYQLIGRMNGERTVDQIYAEAREHLGEETPSQREVVSLIGDLYRANVILTDQPPDVGSMAARTHKTKRKKLTQQFMMPLAIRVPLLDPEKFLHRTRRLAHIVYSWPAFFIWLALVGAGCVLASVHWSALTENLSDRVLASENLLIMALVYPVVKAFHEMGHAYAVKRFDGEVHEIGVMMLAFYPVPYVDATAASAFRGKHERMLVGMAGIVVEVMLAALAMMVWTLLEPGVLRAICLNVMIVSGVSTVLFNGNPLLRFDAYYVLSDALEIPNLASRGTAYVGYMTKRLLGIRGATNPSEGGGESFWLGFYAIVSFFYRVLVMVGISLFIASKYLFFGVLLALWSSYLMFVHPLLKIIGAPLRDPMMRPHSRRLYMIGGGGFLALVLLLFVIPAPYATRLDGVVWVRDEAVLRAGSSGTITDILASSGNEVTEGQPLIALNNDELDAEVALLQAQLEEAQLSYQASLRDPVTASVMVQRIDLFRQELARAEAAQDALTLTSPLSGKLVMPREKELKGRYLERGRRIGYVTASDHLQIIAPVKEADIDRVLKDSRAIRVRFASDVGDVHKAVIDRSVPAATKQLPSEVLSLEGGGKFALDPGADDRLTSFQEFFLVALTVENMPVRPVEERVRILFRHSMEPVGYRIYRAVRRAFLRLFDV